jgi:hypothetical protein
MFLLFTSCSIQRGTSDKVVLFLYGCQSKLLDQHQLIADIYGSLSPSSSLLNSTHLHARTNSPTQANQYLSLLSTGSLPQLHIKPEGKKGKVHCRGWCSEI